MRSILLKLTPLLLAALVFSGKAQAVIPTTTTLHALGDPQTTLAIAPQTKNGVNGYAFTLASTNSEFLAMYRSARISLDCGYSVQEADSSWSKSSISEEGIWRSNQASYVFWAANIMNNSTTLAPFSQLACSIIGPYNQQILPFVADSGVGDIGDAKLQSDMIFDTRIREGIAFKWALFGATNSRWEKNFLCVASPEERLMRVFLMSPGCVDQTVASLSDVQDRGVVYRVGPSTTYSTKIAYRVGGATVQYPASAWDWGVAFALAQLAFYSPRVGKANVPSSSEQAKRMLQAVINKSYGRVLDRVYSVAVLSAKSKPHQYRGRHVGIWVSLNPRSRELSLQLRFGKRGRADMQFNIPASPSGEGYSGMSYSIPSSSNWPAYLYDGAAQDSYPVN